MKNFLNNFSYFFTKLSQNPKLVYCAILAVCILGYGLTLNMYFWKDDFAVMIKAANPEESVGFLGAGIKGKGAYSYVATPFIFLYPTFGLNAFWYFLVGLILYFMSAISLFHLAREIFKENHKALLVSLIYSAGYIGADTLYGLMNSFQTSWITISLCFSLLFLIRHFEKGGILNYLISIALFYFSLETGYVRAHGFFLIILSAIFIVVKKVNLKNLFLLVIKFIPFALIFKKFYLGNVTAGVGSSRFTQSLADSNLDYFLNPFITFANLIFPSGAVNSANKFIANFAGRTFSENKIYLILGIFFILANIVLVATLLIKFRRDHAIRDAVLKNIKILAFGIFSALGSFIGVFYIAAAAAPLSSTHRYLTTGLIGLAFYWVSFFTLINIKSKKVKRNITFLSISLVALYLLLGNLYTLENITIRTNPQKKFFSQLKNYIPNLPKNSFIYIDYSNKNNTPGKIGSIFGTGMVGGSPEITVHYGVDRYSLVTEIGSFDNFLTRFKEGRGNISGVYAFYYEDENLINRTDAFRQILDKGKSQSLSLFSLGLSGDNDYYHEVTLSEGNQPVLENSSFEIILPENLTSLTKSILKFDLKIEPNAVNIQNPNSEVNDKIYLEYLISKADIKKSSNPKVLNHFQSQTPDLLFDDKLETSWMADRGPWHNLTNGITNDIQYIEIALDKPINLGGILFTNGHTLRTPLEYKILIKQNNTWEEIKTTKFTDAKETNEIWFDKLDPAFVSEIRIELQKTSSGDAPQIAEIELVEDKYSHLDFIKAQQIELDPSILLLQDPNSQLVKDYFAQNGKLSLVYRSNKDNDYNVPAINFNIKGLDDTYKYEVVIPANGTNLEKIKFFNLNFPARYVFSNFEFINPPLSYYISNDKTQ